MTSPVQTKLDQARPQARDLEADLAICEAASPGPWTIKDDGIKDKNQFWVCEMIWPNEEGNARFITEAREGWPYAIRRALEAEAEVDRLRNEIQILQEQLEQRCCRT